MSTSNADELSRTFASLDQNGDGQVSIDELEGLLERTGVHTTKGEMELLVGKEALDFDEFSCLHGSLLSSKRGDHGGWFPGKEIKEDEEEEEEESCLYEAFKVFDLDGDGLLSPEEIKHVLVKLGMWNDNGGMDCTRIVRAYDVNSDGFVDFNEFKRMMLAHSSNLAS